MAPKKAVTKKKNKSRATRKPVKKTMRKKKIAKTSTTPTSSRKKSTKKKTSPTKTAKRKPSKKKGVIKAATQKKSTKKKTSATKTAKRKPSKKKGVTKAATKKKSTKKKTSATKTAKRKPSKKKGVTKAATKKKSTKKKTSPKMAAKRKTAENKRINKVASAKKSKMGQRGAIKKSVAKKKPVSRTLAPKKKPLTHARSARTTKRNLLTGPVRGINPYKIKRGEAYMNDAQLDHFRKLLDTWKAELMEEVDRTMSHMKDDAANFPDPNDRATQESEFSLELRTRDRERKLLKKIELALQRVDENNYGYCEATGEEIGLRRLEARPVATLSVEAQEQRELSEKQFRDREDYYR